MYKLSILIPSLLNRTQYLGRLITILNPQLSNEIEVLIDVDNGEQTTGTKRNKLIEKSSGQYTCFVDDDDRVSDDYIKELMIGIDKDVDIVSILGVHTIDGRNPKMVIDTPYCDWKTTPVGYLRGIQHLDALKRSISTRFKFPDRVFGEDKVWGELVSASQLVQTYHQVNHPVYFHEYRSKK